MNRENCSFTAFLDGIRDFVDANRRLILFMVLYKLSLELSYVFVMSPRFSVSLLTTNLNWWKFVVSCILMAATLGMFPRDTEKPSTYLYGILYALIFVPMVSYYWLNDQASVYILVETFCFLLIAALLRSAGKLHFDIRLKKMPDPEIGAWCVKLLFAVYMVATFVLIAKNGGLDFRTLSWSAIYQVRGENSVSGIWGYLLNWCAKSFMPFFFGYFLMSRKYTAVILVCILQCLTFLAFGFKAFLMAVVMLVGVSFLMWFDRKQFNANLVGVLCLGNVVASVIDKLKITDVGMLLLPYRTLMLPAQGQYEYYTFFNHHDYLNFSEGMIGRLFGIPYPYDDQIGRIVNMYIYGPDKQSNGNTGVFSYGFADAGFWGMILSAVIIIALLIIVDRSSRKLPVTFPVCAMAYQMFIMNDNSIFISLNTGGILWTLMLIMVINWAYPAAQVQKTGKINQTIERLYIKGFGWIKEKLGN